MNSRNSAGEMMQPLDFTDRAGLKPSSKVFKAAITNVIRLTEMEKLFHLRIIDDADRERFTFRPGQFLPDKGLGGGNNARLAHPRRKTSSFSLDISGL